jgi:hypothetical protein
MVLPRPRWFGIGDSFSSDYTFRVFISVSVWRLYVLLRFHDVWRQSMNNCFIAALVEQSSQR